MQADSVTSLCCARKANWRADYYRNHGPRSRNGARAAYRLRDTLKVVGAPEVGRAPAVAGLFYVDERDPLSGGTGHTIRVCNRLRVPVALHHTWLQWVAALDYE